MRPFRKWGLFVRLHSQRVSVVMPVRDELPYLDEAVHSILTQSHDCFEFIIGDDCSTDGSREFLRGLAKRDDRIRLIESDVPLGPVGSSNWVAMAATCPLVARMDADDVARADRLAREIAVLDAHPDCVLVGSLFDAMDRNGRLTRPRDRSSLLDGRAPPVHHSTIMYRREVFLRAGGYRARSDFFEDADLYYRMGREGALLALPEPLSRIRFSEHSGRLSCDQTHAEEKFERYFQLANQIRLVGYTRAWATPETPPDSGRLMPTAMVAIGSLRLWSGLRPGVFWRILRRTGLRFNRATAVALIWAAWGSISPATLRAVFRVIIRRRDRAAAQTISDGEVYQWWCSDGAAAPPPQRRWWPSRTPDSQ